MVASTLVIPPKNRGRIEWLDWFRGAAVLAMIETHVVNTFLEPGLREAAWFGWVDWFNGLIAPAFLFIAGYAQGMLWRERSDQPVGFRRKTKRLLVIAALGYALHFPWGELQRKEWTEALRIGTQVDVLQCLAAALVLVLGGQRLAQETSGEKRVAVFQAMLGGLAVGIVAVAPLAMRWTAGPVPVVAFLNHSTGSLFPLFPWAAFVLAGAMLGAVRGLSTAWLIGLGAAIRALAWLLFDGHFSVASVAFFDERLAWVLWLAALCRGVALVWKPRAVLFAGRASLVMYVAHLQIIGWITQAGVPRSGLAWSRVAVVFGAVLASAFAVAVAWERWRTRAARRTG